VPVRARTLAVVVTNSVSGTDPDRSVAADVEDALADGPGASATQVFFREHLAHLRRVCI
jgi:hypothetical protein